MKIFTILSSLLISIVSFAAHQGEIAILSANGESFYVMVDGAFRNYYPQSNVSMQLTSDQMHNVRVIGSSNTFHLDHNLVAKPNRKMIYRIINHSGHYSLAFVKESPLNNIRPYEFSGSQNGTGCCNQNQHPGSHPHGKPHGNHCSGYQHGNPHGQPGNFGQGQFYGAYQSMTPAEFDNLKRAIEHESFSEDKLRVANAAAKNKYMLVSQIKEVARLFTFSDEKLKFTKAAYSNCVDKSNYYEVMEVFTFSSDKRALQEYIDAQ